MSSSSTTSFSSSQSLKKITPTKPLDIQGDILKGIVSGLTYYAIDSYLIKNSNQNQSIGTSASIALSSFATSQMTTQLPDLSQYIPLTSLGNGKMLSQRIIEVGINTGSSYAVNQYLLNNNSYLSRADTMGSVKTIAVLLASDVMGELAKDLFNGSKLGYLS